MEKVQGPCSLAGFHRWLFTEALNGGLLEGRRIRDRDGDFRGGASVFEMQETNNAPV